MIDIYRDAVVITLITTGVMGVYGFYRLYVASIRLLHTIKRNDAAIDDLYGHHNRLQKQVERIAERQSAQ